MFYPQRNLIYKILSFKIDNEIVVIELPVNIYNL